MKEEKSPGCHMPKTNSMLITFLHILNNKNCPIDQTEQTYSSGMEKLPL